MAGSPVELTIEQQGLQALTRALEREADGKKFRRELAANLRVAAEPAKRDVAQAVRSIRSGGLPHADGGSLREAVAANVKVGAILTGRSTGVKVRIPKKGMPRHFRNAPQRLDRQGGWRHPVFGDRDVWVAQTGKPYWKTTLVAHREQYKAAILDAMEAMAQRIARK